VRRASSITALGLAGAVWLTALVMAPVGASSRPPLAPAAAAVMYAAGSIICHQIPDRSFRLGGAQLPVCARCCGLYAGGLLGAMLWAGAAGLGRQPSARIRRWTSANVLRATLVLAALPTLVSVATAWVGWWDPANLLRFTLAVPLGTAIGAVTTAVAAGDLR
jgi:uncharacterized membrane protein